MGDCYIPETVMLLVFGLPARRSVLMVENINKLMARLRIRSVIVFSYVKMHRTLSLDCLTISTFESVRE